MIGGISMYRVTIAYPYSKDAPFNEEHYCKHHMPMAARVIGPEIIKSWTVDRGVGLFGQDPVYSHFCIFIVSSLEDFCKAFTEHSSELLPDIPNYTIFTPILIGSEQIC